MFQLTWQNEEIWHHYSSNEIIPAPPQDPPVHSATMLFWEEHCIECAIPYCYSSCPLYVERRDRKCARFVYGIYPNRQVSGLFDFGADVQFRRWAKLEAKWATRPALFLVDKIRRQARILGQIEKVFNTVADGLQAISPKRRLNGLFTYLRRHWIGRKLESSDSNILLPDALFLKFYYPGQESHNIHLEVLQDKPVFHRNLSVEPGWNEHIIPFSEFIDQPSGDKKLVRIWIEKDAELRLIFTWLDLVSFTEPLILAGEGQNSAPIGVPAEKVKCVAWDLDNTLWEGVIGDAGPKNVKPSSEALKFIQQLDERGIIQTLVSKNEFDIAWAKIEELGLAEYFLYPAIHWGPKSESLRKIAIKLNINLDTFALIDDSPFERGEVSSALPQVRIFDPADIENLLERNEFNVPVTDESRTRRQKYLTESQRKQIKASWRGDYESFLRDCNIVMQIRSPKEEHKARCLELIQRSNQLNLSARRYSAEEFDALLADSRYECFAFDILDKYGDYGIVGFVAVEEAEDRPILTDFVLSCRVAQKKVEETFIFWYARRVQERGAQGLRAQLQVTDRNAPLREVLANLSFRCVKEKDTEQLLEFDFDKTVEVPSIIQIEEGQ